MVYFMGANRNSKELQVTPYCMWDKYEVRNITIEQLRVTRIHRRNLLTQANKLGYKIKIESTYQKEISIDYGLYIYYVNDLWIYLYS